MSNRIEGSQRRDDPVVFHVVPDPPKQAKGMTLELPSFEQLTATHVNQFVVAGQTVPGHQPDWSALPDDVLVNQESAARARKDEGALQSIAKEWQRRKELRAEPEAREPSSLGTTFEVAAERAKHERFIAFASNPFNKVPDTVRNKHEAHVASLELREKQLQSDEAAKYATKSAALVASLRASGTKLSPADEQRVRAAYEDLLRHPPSFPGPAIGPDKHGVPLEQVEADLRARWEIVELTASSPFAAAAFSSAILHGDTPEQAVTRMKGAEGVGAALEAHFAGMEPAHPRNFYAKDTFH